MAGKQTKLNGKEDIEQNIYARVYDAHVGHHIVATVINRKIHVYDGDTRKVILSCPGRPLMLQVDHDHDGKWEIWIATCGNHVYRKRLDFEDSHTKEPMETEEEVIQSIFEDLLHDPQTDIPAFDTEQHHPEDYVCQISHTDKILSCKGQITAMCCGEDLFAVVCIEENESVVLVYQRKQTQSGIDADDVQRLSLPFCKFPKKTLDQVSKLKVMVSNNNNYLSSSQIKVPSHLFSLLFGWETCVRSLPVLVCCLPDGSVYFYPINPTSHNTHTWTLLCGVDSQIVDILPIKLHRTLSEQESVAAELHSALGLTVKTPSHSFLDAFLVVGTSGKCCLIAAMPTLGSSSYSADCFKVICMFSFPTGVRCVCCKEAVLFVGGSDHSVDKCVLTLHRPEGGERRGFSVSVQRDRLYSANVNIIWLSGQEDSVLCEMASREVIEIDTSAATETDSRETRPQPSLKDLLVAVDVHQAHLHHLHTSHLQHNTFLQQLNLASHLLHRLNTNQNLSPIHCSVTVQSEVGYHSVTYYADVQLTNQTEVALTKDWSVVVVLDEVTGREMSTVTWDPAHRHLPSSHSFKLSHGLQAESSIHFKIPHTYSPTDCGTKINVFLVLQIPLEFQKEKQENVQNSLFVPVCESVVDVFHFLHLKQAGGTLPLLADDTDCVEIEKLVADLKHGGQDVSDTENKPPTQIYSVSEFITVPADKGFSTSVDTLRTLLSDTQVDTDLPHPSCTLHSPCRSLLTVAVETPAQPVASPVTSDDVTSYCVTLKSSDVSLLARARMALTRRLLDLDRTYRPVSVEDFRKMIHKTEVLQQQIETIQDKLGKGDNTASTALTQLCQVYETMHTDAV